MVPSTIQAIRDAMGSMKDPNGRSALQILKEERRKDAIKEKAKFSRWIKD
jgi:hypothetical protein